MVALRNMTDIRVGDEVVYDGRTFRVRGISPMSAIPPRVLLEGLEPGAPVVEVRTDEIEATPRAAEEST